MLFDYIGKTEDVTRRNQKIWQNPEIPFTLLHFMHAFFGYYGKLHCRNLTDFFKKVGEFHFDNENSNVTLLDIWNEVLSKH